MKLIFGCGYLGERVARRWRDQGEKVCCVTRSRQRANSFQREGFATLVADVTERESVANLPVAETVLFAVGFDRSRRETATIEDVYAGGMRNVLAGLNPDVGYFLYISTTGVYGPAGGDWVDEDTPPEPQRDGGRASLAAEQALAAHPIGPNSVILRLAGLYGAGRVPFLKELQEGEPIPAPSRGYLNLIHVDDAAAAVVAADRLPPLDAGPRVYCVSDGCPVERGEFYREVARQIGAPPPQFIEPHPQSQRAARAASNRRVRNAKSLDELNITLTYPDYRAGLAAILSQ